MLIFTSSSLRNLDYCVVLHLPGVSFDEAVDGLDAILKVKSAMESGTEYDVILMDSSMPRIGGGLASSIIRSMGYRGKIYGITGSARDDEISGLLDCGVDKVLMVNNCKTIVIRCRYWSSHCHR